MSRNSDTLPTGYKPEKADVDYGKLLDTALDSLIHTQAKSVSDNYYTLGAMLYARQQQFAADSDWINHVRTEFSGLSMKFVNTAISWYTTWKAIPLKPKQVTISGVQAFEKLNPKPATKQAFVEFAETKNVPVNKAMVAEFAALDRAKTQGIPTRPTTTIPAPIRVDAPETGYAIVEGEDGITVRAVESDGGTDLREAAAQLGTAIHNEIAAGRWPDIQPDPEPTCIVTELTDEKGDYIETLQARFRPDTFDVVLVNADFPNHDSDPRRRYLPKLNSLLRSLLVLLKDDGLILLSTHNPTLHQVWGEMWGHGPMSGFPGILQVICGISEPETTDNSFMAEARLKVLTTTRSVLVFSKKGADCGDRTIRQNIRFEHRLLNFVDGLEKANILDLWAPAADPVIVANCPDAALYYFPA